jgi:hypothetical protein
MKRMVGCIVEVASSLLWLCVYRSDQEAAFVMTKTFRKGIESLGPTSVVNLTFVLMFLR